MNNEKNWSFDIQEIYRMQKKCQLRSVCAVRAGWPGWHFLQIPLVPKAQTIPNQSVENADVAFVKEPLKEMSSLKK